MTAPRSISEHPSRRSVGVGDRCDMCGAQAFVRALFVSGELLFCGHHGRRLADALRAQALLIEDRTSGIGA